jgi:hypothetical protein
MDDRMPTSFSSDQGTVGQGSVSFLTIISRSTFIPMPQTCRWDTIGKTGSFLPEGYFRVTHIVESIFAYDYSIGDEVLRLVYHPDKLEPRTVGPYTITRVHTNGTLSIEVSPGVIERMNVRRVKPYRRWELSPLSYEHDHGNHWEAECDVSGVRTLHSRVWLDWYRWILRI